jgi:amino acid adenylation domain-containing protein
VPFELLLEELQPERSLGHTPVFQVLFNLLDFDPALDPTQAPDGLRLDEPALEMLAPRSHAANFDLTLYARSSGERIDLSLVYDAELFEAATAERMLAHLHRLLEAAVAEPGARASTLPLLSEAERLELLAARNRVAPERPFEPFDRGDVEGTIPERFARAAARGPERVAVRTPGGAVTYGELARRAERVAAALLARGGETGDRVALLFEPGPPLLAAVLGSLAAGRVYVPLDPAHPPRRLAFVLRDSGAAALLTDVEHAARARELADGLPGGGIPVVDVEALEAPAAAPAAAPVDPGAPAYILYTSGSTGEPKGVVQSHRNALHHAAAYTNALHLAAGDRLSLLASFAFDAAVMDVFGALLNGAELVPADLRGDGFEATARWLRAAGVTVYHSTPTVFRQLAPAFGLQRDGGGLPSARAVVLGGEEVLARDLATLRRVFPEDCLLVNGLGPTESTTALQLFVGPAGADGAEDGAGGSGVSGSVPVGFPVEETEVRLLDGEGEDVGILAVGEITVVSPWVALGYWRRPERTAAAFFDEGGRRGYRTGDLGRRLPDGALEYAGRKDAQVKIRGQRVETGEVEAVLTGHPAVREAVVMARPQPAGGLGLAAWVVPVAGHDVDRRELRRRLAERLPSFMVPFVVTLLPELPLTATGKVDRRALPAPEPEVPESAGGGELRGPIEEVLGTIWCDLLSLTAVNRDDGFFELGGHSLAGVRMISRLREALGVELPLARLFSTPTIAGLAAAVAELRAGPAGADLGAAPISPRAAGAEAPLSFAQQRLWFLDHLEGPSAVYNMPLALALSGPLGVAAFEQAVGELERRQEALRTRLPEAGGVPVQRVEPHRPRRLPLADLSGLPEAAGAAEAERLRGAEARRPFDLASGPLFRARLLRLAGARHHLLATLHHTVGDGWSLELLAGETAELYAALGAGRASPLPELPVQYGDFAAWQRRVLDGAAFERLVGFWKSELAGAPPLTDLPLDRPRPEVRSIRGSSTVPAPKVTLRSDTRITAPRASRAAPSPGCARSAGPVPGPPAPR